MKIRRTCIVSTLALLILLLGLAVAYQIRVYFIGKASPESTTLPLVARRIDDRVELVGYTEAQVSEISAVVLFQGRVSSRQYQTNYLVTYLADHRIEFEEGAGDDLKLSLLSVSGSPMKQRYPSQSNLSISQLFAVRRIEDQVVITISPQREQDINLDGLSLGIVYYVHGVGYLYLLPVD
ncbi:hypothetical protein IT575_10235 [bacterium]|nr:hypothetical protein [bacterium]